MAANWKRVHTLTLTALTLVIVLGNVVIPDRRRVWAWGLTTLLLVVFIAVAGKGISGLWRGALIDERNQISLSRFQMFVWTVVLLSGILTIAMYNIGATSTPLSIAIPTELWALVGISTASLVGSPLVRSTHEDKDPDPQQLDEAKVHAARLYGGDKEDYTHRGLIMMNKKPEQASWANLFMTEETGNTGSLDLAKIQMFFFTVILVVAYAFALGALLAGSSRVIDAFPELTAGMVALLGISHAGYLTNKAISRSDQA